MLVFYVSDRYIDRMAPKYRCSGDKPAAHVACDFTTDSYEAAMDHFEQTSHSVDEQCLAVECDELYHTATYSDLPVDPYSKYLCDRCGAPITDLQHIVYNATTGEFFHDELMVREGYCKPARAIDARVQS